MPELIRTEVPTRPHAMSQPLYWKQDSGEYYVRVVRPGRKDRWVPLNTTDKKTALERLRSTGVDRLIELFSDAQFKEAAIEAVQSVDAKRLEDVVDQWLEDLALRLRSSSMCHPRAIGRQFLDIFPPHVAIGAVTPLRISSWINAGFTMSHRQRRMSVLNSLFEYAVSQGFRRDNPVKRVGLRLEDLTMEQMERSIKEPFTEEEHRQFIGCAEIEPFWRWAFQLGWWLGLRIGDCCCLQWGSFCAEPGRLVFWQRKTRRRLSLDLKDPLLGAGVLNQVVAEMRAQADDPTYCFPEWQKLYTSKDRRDCSDAFWEACQTAGLDGTKTFHCLRKTAALRWESAGKSIESIGRLLGHESLTNTAIYLERK